MSKINFQDVSFVYNPKSPFRYDALKDVNLEIEEKGFTALVGKTGSGKSTIIQHINALLIPSEGQVIVGNFVNSSDKKKRSKNLHGLRKHVGLVFQFPEYQLFEESVLKDCAFGPRNFGVKANDAIIAAKAALKAVGLDESFYDRSPFELSGGEKRRVAIAGILAINPDILVLDEPTSGLDPEGAKEMMDLFKSINEAGTGIILVTHDMDIVLNYCSSVIVVDEGKIALQKRPEDLFLDDVASYSLQRPLLFSTVESLNNKGLKLNNSSIKDIDSLADAILEAKA